MDIPFAHRIKPVLGFGVSVISTAICPSKRMAELRHSENDPFFGTAFLIPSKGCSKKSETEGHYLAEIGRHAVLQSDGS